MASRILQKMANMAWAAADTEYSACARRRRPLLYVVYEGGSQKKAAVSRKNRR